jgi:hypothetical protein
MIAIMQESQGAHLTDNSYQAGHFALQKLGGVAPRAFLRCTTQIFSLWRRVTVEKVKISH